MNSSLACIPCLLNQTLNAVRYVSSDAKQHEETMREVLSLASTLDFAVPPPAIVRIIHERIRNSTGVVDPYEAEKKRANRMALSLLPELMARVGSADDPFEMAVRLSIAGNVIDLGVYDEIDRDDLRKAIYSALNKPLYGDVDAFRAEVSAAKRILFIADNAGEIVFDRMLVEQLRFRRVTVAVRGGPILNDATYNDALSTALVDVVEVIDTGSDAPGVLLDVCSEQFRRVFEESDVIVSKGQGNYEGLSGIEANIYFLLKVKCHVIASCTGRAVGSHLLTGAFEHREGEYK
jgi:damage-control phosphatase, subfamily I